MNKYEKILTAISAFEQALPPKEEMDLIPSEMSDAYTRVLIGLVTMTVSAVNQLHKEQE